MGGLVDFMCFPVSARTQNKGCCEAYGGASCGTSPAEPANPNPPIPAPAPPTDDSPNLAWTQSAYGGVIPIVFGSDLISGNVIWATPFTKHTFTTADAKQKYYYSVSLAIALCEGEIDHLLRLYVGDQLVLDNTTKTNPDGTPVQDINGAISSLSVDLTTPDSPLATIAPDQRQTRITIYSGKANQTPPAVMVAQEGYEYTPAYRGTAFLLIENWLVVDSIPSISAEISANTTSLYPRIVGSQSDTALSGFEQRSIMYLPGYNVFMTGAIAVDGSFGSRNNALAVWDGNTLEYIKSSVMGVAQMPDSSKRTPDAAYLLTSGNVLYVKSVGGNSSCYTVWSPFSNTVLSESGVSGSNGSHGAGGPDGSYDDGIRIVRGLDTQGLPCDIVFCTSHPLSPNRGNIAIMTISDTGQITYVYRTNANDVATRGCTALWGGGITSAAVTIPTSVANDVPAFSDGHSTLGPHIYYFSINVDATDLNIYVDRLDFDSQSDGTVSLTAPRMVAQDIIPGGDLFGTRLYMRKAMFCESDLTIVVIVDTVALTSQMSTVFFKYDILNDRIVWKTPILTGQGGLGVGNNGYFDRGVVDDISNGKWVWIDRLDHDTVRSIDLKTGVVKTEFSCAAQGIASYNSAPAGFSSSRYDGREDSILLWGRSASASPIKVFLSRTNRAQVPLTSIITKLLARVDWREADISIKGFDTLAVDGYSINGAGASLRQAFNELQQVFTFDIVESNGEIAYKQRGNITVADVYEVKLQSASEGGADPWLTETHEYDLAGARKISLSYRDIDRDYKTNVQSVQLPKYDNAIVDSDAAISVQVPIALSADAARRLAEILLYAKITYQAGFTGSLPPYSMPFDPSDVVRFKFNPVDNLDDVIIRFRQTSIGADYSYQFTGSREDPDIYADQVNLFGTLGRYTPPTIPEPPSRVDFMLLDIPFTSETQAKANDAAPSSYPIYMALTTLRETTAKLPKDDITVTTDTASYPVPAVQNFPTWGFVTTPVRNNPECYTTGFNETITVYMMATTGALLGSCTDYYDMLNNRTKNLAYVGNELIQFQTAVDNGDGTWTLSVIRHALFGTEDGATSHGKGEKFVLLGGADGLINTRSLSLTKVELGDGALKSILVQMPTSKNLAQGDLRALYLSKQFRPYRPGAGQINYSGNDAVVSWKRRSRYNGQWPDDGSEAGLPPFTDASPLISVPTFDLYLTTTPTTFNPADASTYKRKTTISNAQSFTYTDAMQTADGFTRTTQTLVAVVYQTVNVTGLDSSLGLMFSRGPVG